MYLRMAQRMLTRTDMRLLMKFAVNFGFKGMRSVQRHKARLKRGEYFPPFLYISVINSCNLHCKGCWVDVKAKQSRIEPERMHRMLNEAKAEGNALFGILGGEPFMHRELLDILDQHRDAYFQVFTNGQLITAEIAARLREMGNVTPLISIEGNEIVSDDRRGNDDVYAKTLAGLQHCLDQKLITGVATSVAANNIDDLVQESWLDRLIEMGVLYAWFYTYRPIGPQPSADLALTPEQQLRVRKFVVEMRTKKPIGIIDAYYDNNGRALCPAVTGISHHISPYGDIEPCPIVQFARESIDDERGLKAAFQQSEFLQDFRRMAAAETRGCIVLERPDLVKALAEKHGAKDTTVRQAAVAELDALTARPSQYNPENEVPEKAWPYRFAKKYWFNDFGAYADFKTR